MSTTDLVQAAITARQHAEAAEESSSPHRWAEADAYAELSRFGWSLRRIAGGRLRTGLLQLAHYRPDIVQRMLVGGVKQTKPKETFEQFHRRVRQLGKKAEAERTKSISPETADARQKLVTDFIDAQPADRPDDVDIQAKPFEKWTDLQYAEHSLNHIKAAMKKAAGVRVKDRNPEIIDRLADNFYRFANGLREFAQTLREKAEPAGVTQ